MKKLLQTLKARFEQNSARHPEMAWEKLSALEEMERTGGDGRRDFDRGGIPPTPKARGVRHQNLELAENARRNQKARRGAVR